MHACMHIRVYVCVCVWCRTTHATWRWCALLRTLPEDDSPHYARNLKMGCRTTHATWRRVAPPFMQLLSIPFFGVYLLIIVKIWMCHIWMCRIHKIIHTCLYVHATWRRLAPLRTQFEDGVPHHARNLMTGCPTVHSHMHVWMHTNVYIKIQVSTVYNWYVHTKQYWNFCVNERYIIHRPPTHEWVREWIHWIRSAPGYTYVHM